jgi:RND family efflux transporter MFP subunit
MGFGGYARFLIDGYAWKDDHMNSNETEPHQPDAPPGGRKRRAVVMLMSLAVIAVAVVIAVVLVFTKPKAGKRHPHAKMNPLVNVISVRPETHTVTVQVMGTVVPAKELILKPRVTGEIVRMHPEFTKGGLLEKGEELLRIDDLDYRLVVAQKNSAVADARYALKLEMGRQEIARREWQLLSDDNPEAAGDAELALRKPHLEKAQSDLVAAEAELEAARLQLARTRIVAPFNAIVREISVQQGSQVTPQENIATLVNTDTYWIQASIPVNQLQWIDIPGRDATMGSDVVVRYQEDATRTGQVIKLLSDLEKQGRMARLVIRIADPLSLASPGTQPPAMLIGEYVQIDIRGRRVADTYRIPREALREHSRVWIIAKDNTLEIREVIVAWRDTQSVIVKQGLQPDERVVISDLAAPVKGMAVDIDSIGEPLIRPASTPASKSAKG